MYANWLYFVGSNKNPTEIFVYGLSLPTAQDITFSLHKEDLGSIEGGRRLFLFRSVTNISGFLDIERSVINLIKINNKIQRDVLKFIGKKTFVQAHEESSLDQMVESPISSLVNITSYYSNEFLNINPGIYINLLRLLEESNNQKFYGKYSKRLGCYEVGEVQPWAEDTLPFSLDYNKETGKYVFNKKENFDQEVTVILKCYHSAEEKISDQLIVVPKTENNVEFDGCGLELDGYWGYRYSVYNIEGKLLHEDLGVLLKEIHFSMNLIGGTMINIKDRFSDMDKKLESVSLDSPANDFVVKDPNEDKSYKKIKEAHIKLYDLVKNDKISPMEGRWFRKGKDDLSDVVFYIKSLVKGASEVIIVDPYADENIIALILRLSVQNVKIISCKNHLTEKIKSKVTDLQEQIKNKRIGLSCSEFYGIPKKFHDRFLMIKTEELLKVYCLPNSVNAMPKTSDFLILKLNGKVKHQAVEHINELLFMCTLENKIEDANEK